MLYPVETIRHSTAHLLAEAVASLWPKTRLGVGPVIEHGFYYDLDVRDREDNAVRLTPDHLPKLEKRMRELIARKEAFRREELPIDQAIEFFRERGQDFKVELLCDLKEKGTTAVRPEEVQDVGGKPNIASVYYTGEKFVDLCRGPHVASTADLGAFKLTTIAGAYWRGKETNPQLQRVYGLAFASQAELDAHFTMLAEAEKRDHRKLGKELELFTFSDYVGPGLPIWLPNGAIVADELERLAAETERAAGYVRVRTPHIAKEVMYTTSGHLPYYAGSMFPPLVMDEGGGHTERYYLKAMNCPHHHQIYASKPRSYRALPLRLTEYGTVYRYEQSGELFGLMRVRMMQMNDAHIYCTPEQFADEFQAVNDMYLQYFKLFGFKKYVMRFSTHDPRELGKKYVDEAKLWLQTEDMVRRVLKESGITYIEVANEAAFYGPKIDVQVWSSIGREFSIATNQVDFAVPKRFGLTYTDADGTEKTPIVIHRAPLGTHERFIGFLIEHYAGAFPTWLAPLQLALVPVGTKHVTACKKLVKEFAAAGIRYELAMPDETVGKRIRTYEKLKVPYMLVIGDKEAPALGGSASGGKLQVRVRGKEKLLAIGRKQFLSRIQTEIAKRKS